MIKKIFILIVTFSLLSIKDTHAYIDPGSGSFFIQMLLAFIASIIFFFKDLLIKIKSILQNIKKKFLKKKNNY